MDWLILPRIYHLSNMLLMSAASVTFRKARARHSAPLASSLNLSATIVVGYESSILDRLGHKKTFVKQFPIDFRNLLSRSWPAPPTPQCIERLLCGSVACQIKDLTHVLRFSTTSSSKLARCSSSTSI